MVTTRELGAGNGGTKAREDRGSSTAVILNQGVGGGGFHPRGGGHGPRVAYQNIRGEQQ